MIRRRVGHLGLEALALTERQHEKVQVCENKWMKRIMGVKRAGKRRMDEEKLMRSWLK